MAGAKSAGYKLATYKSSDGPRAGIIVGDDVFDAAKADRQGGLRHGDGHHGRLESGRAGAEEAAVAGAAKSKAKRQPLKKTKLLAPVRFPSAIYCAGANYADHAAEMAARKRAIRRRPIPHTLGPQGLALPQGRRRYHRSGRDGADFQLCQEHGLGDRARRRHRPARARTSRSRRRCPMSPATPSPTISRPATAAAAPACPMPRRSSWTGPSTRPSRAPARSGRGSCRRATSATRRSSA